MYIRRCSFAPRRAYRPSIRPEGWSPGLARGFTPAVGRAGTALRMSGLVSSTPVRCVLRLVRPCSTAMRGVNPMLGWALVFLVVALIAGLFGFTGLAVASAGIAQILFYIFVVLFVVSGLVYLVRGRAPPTI